MLGVRTPSAAEIASFEVALLEEITPLERLAFAEADDENQRRAIWRLLLDVHDDRLPVFTKRSVH